jgi:hypothetical protein
MARDAQAEKALAIESQRSEQLRLKSNDFEDKMQKAHARIRELEGAVNVSQVRPPPCACAFLVHVDIDGCPFTLM